jgi:ABC-type lipoprotein release transport system permease subunit
MRAVGAQRSLISKMLFSEVCILSLGFGAAGVAAGLVSTFIVRSMELKAGNDLLQLLCGGDTFRPVLGIDGIAATFVQLAIVVVLASLYPVRVAHSITPLDAVSRD